MSSDDKYTIEPLLRADLPQLAVHVQNSKLPLTINRLLFKDWPNHDAQAANYRGAMMAGADDPAMTRFKIVEKATGEMVAHLVLTHKQKQERANDLKEAEGPMPSAPASMNAEVLYAVMRANMQLTVENVEHIELTHMVVELPHRKQGLGTRLVSLAREQASKAVLPLHLSSEPEAVEFFVKQGFQVTKHAEIDLAQRAPPYSGFGPFRLFALSDAAKTQEEKA